MVKEYLLGNMACTYLSSSDISCDVLLEAYFLDIFLHTFGMWLGNILGHVVDELMRRLYFTQFMRHSLIYS
jgi:hypothetical protein